MIWCKTGLWLFILFSCLGGSSGFGQSLKVWDAKERSSLGGQKVGGRFIEKLLSVPLNPNNLKDGYFDLYYYTLQPVNVDKIKKRTVLYVAGGPGQINRHLVDVDTHVNFFFNHGYQVVFFHLRGSGFSQLPPSNYFDQFIRTRFAVKDIEAIRQDLKRQNILRDDGKWDAVVGWSYGTILAQEYTSEYPGSIEKLVLIGPESRHMFARPKVSYGEEFKKFDAEERRIQRVSFDRILQLLPELEDAKYNSVDNIDRDAVLEQIFGEEGIVKKAEDLFGKVQFVIENYCDLQTELENSQLRYSRAFFQNLRSLRASGSVPLRSDRDNRERVIVAKAIINELRQGPQKDNACNRAVEE